MGKSDIIAKEYMADNAIFADVFNYLLYDGSSVLKCNLRRAAATGAFASGHLAESNGHPC